MYAYEMEITNCLVAKYQNLSPSQQTLYHELKIKYPNKDTREIFAMMGL